MLLVVSIIIGNAKTLSHTFLHGVPSTIQQLNSFTLATTEKYCPVFVDPAIIKIIVKSIMYFGSECTRIHHRAFIFQKKLEHMQCLQAVLLLFFLFCMHFSISI